MCAYMSIPIIHSRASKHLLNWPAEPLEPLDFCYYWTLMN